MGVVRHRIGLPRIDRRYAACYGVPHGYRPRSTNLAPPVTSQPDTAPAPPSGRAPLPVFPNYLQIPSRAPTRVWWSCRVISVAGAVALVLLSFVRPSAGLFIFWQLFVPALPLWFLLAPGLWRNICPLAALNQTPRLAAFTRGISLPGWLGEYSYVIAIAGFIILVATRKALFNHNGAALGVLILAALALAFLMGVIFKGKSGWCGSICPLLPVQRLYGQSPFALVPNSYCRPCVSCVKHCYDFNPRVAYLADLHDESRSHADQRKLFAGAVPGLILAYFTVPDPPVISIASMYAQFTLFLLVSIGFLFVVQTFARFSAHTLMSLYGAVALNLFYWFGVPQFITAVAGTGVQDWLRWPAQAALGALTVAWLRRTWAKEPSFVAQGATAQRVPAGDPERSSQLRVPEVTFLPEGRRRRVRPNASLLEVIESMDMRIESGCRMGMCGADPVAIMDGAEHLSGIDDDERTTLERLGLAANTRMACCARVRGPVSVALTPERPRQSRAYATAGYPYDPGVARIVVIGNGIAGVTAADHIRRRHPTCEIHLVARERYQLYNRMGISRLIYGRSAMQGLFLLPETWYDEQRITCWLNTWALGLDVQARRVTLATGDVLPYDRLILATGSSSFVPPIRGFGLPGSFLLREADDAMEMRSFAQGHNCRHAVVAGGGLLGIEAAYALHKLGLHVCVVEHARTLLPRQLDAHSGSLLGTHLEGLGITLLMEAGISAVTGADRVRQVTLTDGRQLPCELFLICAGIRPNVALARDAELEVDQGVIVDDGLRTSDPAIFAVGDVAEHRGSIYGLWPAAVRQAEVGAINAIGGDERYEGTVPVAILKVAGIDLTSIGLLEQHVDDTVIVLDDAERHTYRKLVIRNGRIVGAILLGYPDEATIVAGAIKKSTDVTYYLDALRAGDWNLLDETTADHGSILMPRQAAM